MKGRSVVFGAPGLSAGMVRSCRGGSGGHRLALLLLGGILPPAVLLHRGGEKGGNKVSAFSGSLPRQLPAVLAPPRVSKTGRDTGVHTCRGC